jgi:hypothetical protein
MSFVKKCNRKIGEYWEDYAMLLLPDAIRSNKDNPNADHDLEWQGYRINVKGAKLQNKKTGQYWCFKLHAHYMTCDFFLMIGYVKDNDKSPERAWLIPAELCQKPYYWVYVFCKKLEPYEMELVAI